VKSDNSFYIGKNWKDAEFLFSRIAIYNELKIWRPGWPNEYNPSKKIDFLPKTTNVALPMLTN
jgi:hypothetical protein